MKNLLSKLGFSEKIYSWNDLDASVQQGFIKRIGCSVLILAGSIFIGVVTKDISSFFIFLFASVIYFLVAIYYLLIFYYKKFKVIIAECIKIDLQSKKILKRDSYGKAIMVLKSGDVLYEVTINHLGKYKTGFKMAIYASEKNIIQINNDYYKVLSPLAITVINQIGAYDSENAN